MTSDQPLLDAIMQVSDGPDVDTAPLACISCKQRKSKCDKLLPRCSACIRRKRTCEYARLPKRDISPPSVPVVDRLRHSSRSHEDHGPVQTIDLPTMLFLDPNIISHGQVETVQVPVRIPDHILALLGDFGDIVVVVSKAIEHIDPWMPFISKKRFFDLHLTTSFHNRADVVLLSLALKLVATLPLPGVRNPRTPLYNAIKQFYLEVETSSILSIQVLQAGVLLALYELGHGIYPAAFLSIGACARYAHVMGLGFRGGTSINKVLTLLEFEERRRVWWAIVILDRFVSIGCPGRPFATADPKLSDILPVNDEAWDEGVILPGDSVTLSSPLSGHMSRFALLCQAASLLGQVLVHVADDSDSDEETSAQLDRTLQAMITASLEVAEPDNDQIAFIYSALLCLHSPYLSPNPRLHRQTARIQRAQAVVRMVTDRITTNLTERHCFLGRRAEDISPWGLFFAYQMCSVHMRTPHPTPAEEKVVRGLREAFVSISARWGVAGLYIQLLEAQEVLRRSS